MRLLTGHNTSHSLSEVQSARQDYILATDRLYPGAEFSKHRIKGHPSPSLATWTTSSSHRSIERTCINDCQQRCISTTRGGSIAREDQAGGWSEYQVGPASAGKNEILYRVCSMSSIKSKVRQQWCWYYLPRLRDDWERMYLSRAGCGI